MDLTKRGELITATTFKNAFSAYDVDDPKVLAQILKDDWDRSVEEFARYAVGAKSKEI